MIGAYPLGAYPEGETYQYGYGGLQHILGLGAGNE